MLASRCSAALFVGCGYSGPAPARPDQEDFLPSLSIRSYRRRSAACCTWLGLGLGLGLTRILTLTPTLTLKT